MLTKNSLAKHVFQKLLIWCLMIALPGAVCARFLFNEEEAAKLRFSVAEQINLPEVKSLAQLNASNATGPEIIFLIPELVNPGEIVIPGKTSLHIRFKQQSAPVDIATLQVVVEKFFFSMDITDRLQEYIVDNEIIATNIDIPAGLYSLRLTIRDVQGTGTEALYQLKVEG